MVCLAWVCCMGAVHGPLRPSLRGRPPSWFSSFSVEESSERPYQFALTAAFEVDHEVLSFRSTVGDLGDPAFGDLAQPNQDVDILNG